MAKRRATRSKGSGKAFSFGGKGKDLFGFKKQIVKGVSNNTIYMGAGGVLLLGGVVMLGVMGVIPLPGLGNASTATVNVFPANVKTGEMVTVSGDFRGANGQVVTLPSAYIAVFEDTGNKVFDSSLGMFVSHYSIQVNTANYRDGSFTVVVSDQPINAPPGVTANPVTGAASLSPQTPPQMIQAPSVGAPAVTLT